MILHRVLSKLSSAFYNLHGSVWTGDSDDIVAFHRPDGTFVKVSASAKSIAGYDAADLVGLSLANITAPDDQGDALGALAKACACGQKGRGQFKLLRADGTTCWAEMTASVDASGYVRTVIRDISLRKAPNTPLATVSVSGAETAIEADKGIPTEYLADLSHEIRTPLNAVIGFADAIKNETFGPVGHAKYDEYARLIKKSGEHVLELVSDMLDLSKIEADKYELECTSLDLPDLLQECADIIKGTAAHTGLWVRTDFPENMPRLQADPRVIRQVVLNLLSNAVKFTKAGGVTLKLRHDDKHCWISVSDTGIGMTDEQLTLVGERFSKAQREGVRGAKGTGLGLALCHGLAQVHDGELRLTSGLGEGTQATFEFPYVGAPMVQSDDPFVNLTAELEAIIPPRSQSAPSVTPDIASISSDKYVSVLDTVLAKAS